MRGKAGNPERGIAIFFTTLALMLMTAITVALVLVGTAETAVNGNYRSESVVFFAARSGIAEAEDRMMPTTAATPQIVPPSVLPSATGGVVYLINQGGLATAVQPWVASTTNAPNPYMDDDLCHDGYAIAGMSSAPPDVPCTTVPSGSAWYTSVTSNAPWSGTSAALPYQWVRITLKANGSVQHLNPGSGTNPPSTTNYYVNSSQPATDVVCWNGVSEIVAVAACPAGDSNVYLLTALAVAPNGSRTMVQAEVTINSTAAAAYGLYATSNACPSISFSGNGTTDSYSTAGYTAANAQNAYAATVLQTGGSIATPGTVQLAGNAAIGGNIAAGNTTQGGACPAGLIINGANAGMVKGQTPPNQLTQAATVNYVVPNAPNPATSPGVVTYTSNVSLTPPGPYGDIVIAGGTLTLAPGTYSINSLTITGQGAITVSGSGSVVLNIGGNGITGTTPVINVAGQGVLNSTYVPENFIIDYAGTQPVAVAGSPNQSVYFILDAPNAPLTYSGNGAVYGAMIGSTIVDSGNGAVHYDRNSNAITTQANGNFFTLAFRSLPY